jgi:hypothetical protein
MKAEHRKELQTNALADRIGRFFKGVKTKTQATSALIWVAVLLVIVVIGAWIYFSKKAKNNRSQRLVDVQRVIQEIVSQRNSMDRFGSSENLKKAEKDLTALINKYPGTEAATIARFQLAELHLRDLGLDRLAGGDPAALENIETASKEYLDLADEFKDDPVWGPQALMGVAKSTEAKAAKDLRNLKKAEASYADVAKNYPDSAQAREATAMLDKLQNAKARARIENIYRDLGGKK